ncbi:P [Dog Tick rhabdovirus-1]|nr:P [Dog Tick rhabdovirus-1] [Dog Tick rhabdovirus-1]
MSNLMTPSQVASSIKDGSAARLAERAARSAASLLDGMEDDLPQSSGGGFGEVAKLNIANNKRKEDGKSLITMQEFKEWMASGVEPPSTLDERAQAIKMVSGIHKKGSEMAKLQDSLYAEKATERSGDDIADKVITKLMEKGFLPKKAEKKVDYKLTLQTELRNAASAKPGSKALYEALESHVSGMPFVSADYKKAISDVLNIFNAAWAEQKTAELGLAVSQINTMLPEVLMKQDECLKGMSNIGKLVQAKKEVEHPQSRTPELDAGLLRSVVGSPVTPLTRFLDSMDWPAMKGWPNVIEYWATRMLQGEEMAEVSAETAKEIWKGVDGNLDLLMIGAIPLGNRKMAFDMIVEGGSVAVATAIAGSGARVPMMAKCGVISVLKGRGPNSMNEAPVMTTDTFQKLGQ